MPCPDKKPVKKDYKINNGCHNCKHVQTICDYESSEEFFCNINKDRPKSGSCAMKEMFNYNNSEEYHRDSNLWDEWVDTHSVEPYGICELWNKTRKKEKSKCLLRPS
jgi:hypothetical protein